ncbi:MAG: hypothetical protein J6C37_07280 [Roseburia sp.]|nr:hypothetical protein [Roseburia sp.]
MKQITEKLAKIPAGYQPIPFWSWNDALDPEELKRQIHWMYDNGIGGFFMHARGGLKTSYLSEEWMHCTETCCDEAEKLGMNAWAYDENGWPSGFAGGKLLEDEANRDMYILHKTGAFDASADVSYLLDGDKLIRVGETTAADGQYLNLYLRRSASTVDILNPDVVQKFINITHEQYKEHFGEDFSKKVKGFFTDEPQYYRWDTPYTPMVKTYFKERYGEDIFDNLGLLFVEKEGYRTFRYRYWLSMQKLMVQNFGKKIYDWCEENGVQLTGHYVEESSMGYQIMCCGGTMPFYEYEHIPGIDWLGAGTDNELAARQLGSAARQLGKKQMLTETFGCCGWDISPSELRRVAGFQYACGVNLMCHHLVPYSEHGQRKRDYPAHYHPVNPWVKEHFKDFNDYFSRLGMLLADGEEPVNVAMLHPIRSAYFDYKRDQESTGFAVRELDEKLHEACRILSSRGIAYHFLDETLLETHGFVDGDSIGCGQCSYQYLVLPRILTMGAHTEKLIRRFVEGGGKVLLLDGKPEYLEGKPQDYSYLSSNCSLEEIVQAQPFAVENADTDIYCAYRKLDDTSFLFIQNASNCNAYTQTFRFMQNSFECCGEEIRSFLALDPLTLETKQMPLTVTLPENGALLLIPSTEAAPAQKALQEYELQFADATVEFDTNFLTLDMVRYSKDGENYSEPLLRNKLFHQLLEERYEGALWLKYDFEIQTVPETLTLLAEKGDATRFYINGQPLDFAKACEDEPTLWMADISALVQEGWNNYEVVLPWHQSEETYYALFGEGVTESLRNCIAYDSEIEDVYLAGKFGVYSHSDYEDYDSSTVCGHDFYIGAVPAKVSEPTIEGLPFFRGKLTLRQNVVLADANTLLKVKGRYQTAGIHVNGQYAGELFFEHQLDISPYAKQGENKIEVEFTIGNRNLLGPFHFAGSEAGVGPGTFEAHNLPDSKDGHARYKLFRLYAL